LALTSEKAFELLGLPMMATETEIKRAYRKLALRTHPDHNTAPNAKDQMILLTEAYETAMRMWRERDAREKAKRKRAERREQAARQKAEKAEREAREQAEREAKEKAEAAAREAEEQRAKEQAERAQREWTQALLAFQHADWAIQILQAIAGGGKTRELTCAIAAERFANVVFAAPTIDLLNEIEVWLKEWGCIAPTVTIHSGGHATRAVRDRLTKWFIQQHDKGDPPAVLLASHQAMAYLATPSDAGRYDLIFDETPDVCGFIQMQMPRRHFVITALIKPIDYLPGVVRLECGDGANDRKFLATIAGNGIGMIEYDMVDSVFQPLAASVLNPHTVVLCSEDAWVDLTSGARPKVLGGELDVLCVTHPAKFKPWRSVTIAAARVRMSLTCLLWERLFQQPLCVHSLQPRLPQRHVNGHRLAIRYFFEERATRSTLSLSSTTGDSMQGGMVKAVAEYFGDREFLWSLPQPTDKGGVKNTFWHNGRGPAFKPTLRLGGKSFGQNVYREHTRLALLSVILFTPGQYQLLLALGLTQEEIDQAHSWTILYQDLLRSAIRDEQGDEVEVIVPCLPSAKALATEFDGCTIARMPDHLIPQRAGQQKRGPKPREHKMSDAERQRKSRANRRARAEREREKQAENADVSQR
jgi:hypothetical protein